jgi:hypothetical protein
MVRKNRIFYKATYGGIRSSGNEKKAVLRLF